MTQEELRFDGADYSSDRDNPRLKGKILRVWDVMKDGRWRTLRQIADLTHDPEASISAQLRHLRKDRFGAHQIEREYIDNGAYKYRLIINEEKGFHVS